MIINTKTLITLMFIFFCFSKSTFAWQEGAGYLRLNAMLDRPQDGYCLDVAGSGNWVDLTVPLNVHNCKGPHFYADEAVIFDNKTNTIRFPAYDACVTSLGRDGRSLPKTPLILRPCAHNPKTRQSPFHPANLQSFIHRRDGRIELKNTNLCLTAGNVSDVTFSPDHKWRALYLDTCSIAPKKLSVWKAFQPRRSAIK
ncbi:MAG: hypothetical protein ACRBBR_02825 [Cellvibrionaceae bacterium]